MMMMTMKVSPFEVEINSNRVHFNKLLTSANCLDDLFTVTDFLSLSRLRPRSLTASRALGTVGTIVKQQIIAAQKYWKLNCLE